ncbi:unnamed protein product [Closterium sp. Naga37s-1]|nr:unnamed protein product [Closterium sp. Naga37s-1]
MATKDSLPKPITAADDVKEAPHTVMILKRPYENVQDQYSMGKELGRGQYGVIRECKDKMTGVPFACKSISKTKLSGTREVEDVQREIKVMEVLRGHSAVIELHATYEDQKRVHLIMELCEGGELFERISQRHHYPEDEAALLTRTLISVVHHCQAHGLMHRDLKPENILLVNRKSHTQVKVVDYGLAAFVKPGGKLTTMAGSAYYIAPEVLNNNYGMEADMWSVGVILYILLCGLPPFWAEKEEGIFEAIKTGKVDVFSGGWESVSMDAKDLVLRMLTRDPQKRITPEKALGEWMAGGGFAEVCWGEKEKEEGIFEAIKTGKVDVFSGGWESVSMDAKNLVLRMLTRDPQKRITPEKALVFSPSFPPILTHHHSPSPPVRSPTFLLVKCCLPLPPLPPPHPNRCSLSPSLLLPGRPPLSHSPRPPIRPPAHRWIKQHCSNAADHVPGLPAKPVTADSRAHRKAGDSPRIPLPDGDRRGSSSSSSSRNIASSSASRSGGAGGYRYGKDGDLATVLASADLAAVADAVAAIRASGAGEERKEELAALLKLQAKLKAKEGAGGEGGAAGGSSSSSSSRRPESASAASSRRSARDVERALAGALAAKGGGGSSDRARRSSSNMSRTKTADTGALLAALADLQDGGGGGGERGGGRHRRTGSRGTDAGDDEEERKRHRDRDRDGGKGGKKQDDSVKEMFAAAKDALRGKEKDGGGGKEDKERLAKLLAKMEEVKAWEKDRTGARPSSSASRSSRRGDDGDEKGGRDRGRGGGEDGGASSRFPRDSSTSSRSSNADRLSRYRSDAASMLGALEEETGKDDASPRDRERELRDRGKDEKERGKDKVPTTPGSLRRDKADSSSKSKKSSGGGGIIRHKSADISKMLNVGGDDGDGGGRKGRGGRDTDSLAGGIGKSGGGGGRSSGRKMERSASNQSQLLLGQQSAEGRGSDGGRSGGAARRGLDRSRSPDGKGRSGKDGEGRHGRKSSIDLEEKEREEGKRSPSVKGKDDKEEAVGGRGSSSGGRRASNRDLVRRMSPSWRSDEDSVSSPSRPPTGSRLRGTGSSSSRRQMESPSGSGGSGRERSGGAVSGRSLQVLEESDAEGGGWTSVKNPGESPGSGKEKKGGGDEAKGEGGGGGKEGGDEEGGGGKVTANGVAEEGEAGEGGGDAEGAGGEEGKTGDAVAEGVNGTHGKEKERERERGGDGDYQRTDSRSSRTGSYSRDRDRDRDRDRASGYGHTASGRGGIPKSPRQGGGAGVPLRSPKRGGRDGEDGGAGDDSALSRNKSVSASWLEAEEVKRGEGGGHERGERDGRRERGGRRGEDGGGEFGGFGGGGRERGGGGGWDDDDRSDRSRERNRDRDRDRYRERDRDKDWLREKDGRRESGGGGGGGGSGVSSSSRRGSEAGGSSALRGHRQKSQDLSLLVPQAREGEGGAGSGRRDARSRGGGGEESERESEWERERDGERGGGRHKERERHRERGGRERDGDGDGERRRSGHGGGKGSGLSRHNSSDVSALASAKEAALQHPLATLPPLHLTTHLILLFTVANFRHLLYLSAVPNSWAPSSLSYHHPCFSPTSSSSQSSCPPPRNLLVLPAACQFFFVELTELTCVKHYRVRICFRHCSANPCSHHPAPTTNQPQLLHRSLPLLGLLPYLHLPPPPLPLAASHSHHDLASSCRSQARAFRRFHGAHRSFPPLIFIPSTNFRPSALLTMFRSAKRVLLPAARAAAGVARIHGSAAAPAESAGLAEAYKRVAPQLDVPSTPLTYLKERPAVAAAIPEKLTLNLSLPHAVPFSAKEVDSVIIPATSGQMGVLPGHVASIAELKPGLLTVIEGTTETKLFVSSGFAFVHPNSVLDVAAVDAVPLDQIDGEEVKKGLAAAHAKVASASSDLEKAEAQISVDVHTIPLLLAELVRTPQGPLGALPSSPHIHTHPHPHPLTSPPFTPPAAIPSLLAELVRTPQGPLGALTWRSKGVEDAPPPSMASRALTLFGQTASFEDARGKILRVSMGEGVVVNLMATKAGSRRSGDMHNCSQHDVILSGRTNLHLTDLVSGGEEVREYDGRLNVITIPPRVPHMFHFLEDNLMIEWWDCDFQAWYYRPYRDIVEA